MGEGVLHLLVMVEGKTFDIVSRHRGVLAWIPVRTYIDGYTHVPNHVLYNSLATAGLACYSALH